MKFRFQLFGITIGETRISVLEIGKVDPPYSKTTVRGLRVATERERRQRTIGFKIQEDDE
jgi:hypothetical protein